MRVIEWLELIEDPEIKAKAFKNLWHEYADDHRQSMYDALNTAFNWFRSPEGIVYWTETAISLEEHYLTVHIISNDANDIRIKQSYRKFFADIDLYSATKKELVTAALTIVPDDYFNTAISFIILRPMKDTFGKVLETVIDINL